MQDNSSPSPAALDRLIRSQRTLVLATANPQPWVAPVYYLYQNRQFYFFSKAASRHVSEALAANQCAAAVFRESSDWREIEGLQMEGQLQRIDLGREAATVLRGYVAKFPTVKEFFVDAVLDVRHFAARLRTELCAFLPERVYYMHNQVALGQRTEVQLPD